jgi:predicted GNAT superfamily acetyltransferase
VTLRDLHTIDDFRQVVELERAVWEYTDMADVVTMPVFIITVKRGAILVGAFDDRGSMVGFVYSLVGMKGQVPMQWSHMLGVLPTHRGGGLGRALKLAQRDRALAAGYDLIEWTFDPLQALNAHLNFVRLGVVAEEYVENVYGESTSALHRGTPTDRFIVQWRIREPHVERRIARASPLELRAAEVHDAPAVNRVITRGAWPLCEAVALDLDAPRLWAEIPMGFTGLQAQAPERALEWRLQTRTIFEHYLDRGYRVVDFTLDRDRSCGRYLLARTRGVAGPSGPPGRG